MAEGGPTPCRLEIGVFAHNESGNIAGTLRTLNRQDILDNPAFAVRIHILANGCSDDTVAQAHAAIASLEGGREYIVHDLAEGGKSRTWNRFVHDLTDPAADLMLFCDADIDIPNADNASRLVAFQQNNPVCIAASSQAVKDIAHTPSDLSLTDKLISAAAGTLYNWRQSIIGSFYVTDAAMARQFHLPIGLPVEDGFVRPMIMTNVLREPRKPGRIDSEEGIFHIYKSERSLRAVLRHQVRLVIGNSINAVIFSVLARSDNPPEVLAQAAADPEWLTGILAKELPRKYGYVPPKVLTKRLRKFKGSSLKGKLLLMGGFVFDLVVYVIAQFKMSRGVGAGFW